MAPVAGTGTVAVPSVGGAGVAPAAPVPPLQLPPAGAAGPAWHASPSAAGVAPAPAPGVPWVAGPVPVPPAGVGGVPWAAGSVAGAGIAPVPSVAPAGGAAPAAAGGWVRRQLVELALVVLVGTGAGVAADALVGRLDGGPPAYLLLVLVLPFWELLPRRLPRRLAAMAALVGLIGAAWLGIALLLPQPWWRGEVAFGLSCALVGAGQVVLLHRLARRRTVLA
jgi:hypothetical protein